MTRDELRQLGHTDAQLDAWYTEVIGPHMNLADEADDTPVIQERRARFFRTVMIHWQGVQKASDGPKIGSFGVDDPEQHRRMMNESDEP